MRRLVCWTVTWRPPRGVPFRFWNWARVKTAAVAFFARGGASGKDAK
jgi:hypothetical protein